jgi:XTP/dITP diphosphohydrolase
MTRPVVLASRNAGKLAELQALLAPLNLTLRLVSEFSAESLEENGDSFEANALLKARHAAHVSGWPAIADDSGLEVDALEGAPGIYSARFAGAGAADADNNRKLLDQMAGLPAEKRGARFVCVMAYVRNAGDPTPLIARAEWPGRILEAPRGHNGFGYDPLFYVPEHDCSSAELPPGVKNRISHRGRAARALLDQLRA